MSGADKLMLPVIAKECARIASELDAWRNYRDEIALRLIDDGETWRDVAALAGFTNPNIAALKKRQARRGATDIQGSVSVST